MSGETERLTPWTLVFAEERFERVLFPAIEEEVASRSGNTSFDAFLMLRASNRLFRVLESGEDPDPEGDIELPGAEAVRHYGRLAWHAWHFWRHGRQVFAFDERGTRSLLAPDVRIGPWTLQAPVAAAYVQFARNLIWARVDEATHAEPLDGFFWTLEHAAAPPGVTVLHLLLMLGLRQDRPGLSVIQISASPADAGHWGDDQARADGPDFDNILPGGELDALHALLTPAEALKLASRALHATFEGPSGERG